MTEVKPLAKFKFQWVIDAVPSPDEKAVLITDTGVVRYVFRLNDTDHPLKVPMGMYWMRDNRHLFELPYLVIDSLGLDSITQLPLALRDEISFGEVCPGNIFVCATLDFSTIGPKGVNGLKIVQVQLDNLTSPRVYTKVVFPEGNYTLPQYAVSEDSKKLFSSFSTLGHSTKLEDLLVRLKLAHPRKQESRLDIFVIDIKKGGTMKYLGYVKYLPKFSMQSTDEHHLMIITEKETASIMIE